MNARDAQAQATITVTVGGTEFTCTDPKDPKATNTPTDYTFKGAGSGKIVVKVARDSKMKKAIYVKKVDVTFAKQGTSPLVSIGLSGEYPTTFKEGDEFSHEGMEVTATYEDNSENDVTSSASFSGYDMSKIGEQTVTVNYTEGEVTKTAEYQITVNAIPTHTVTWNVNGTTTTADYKEGAAITFPENPDDVEGLTFQGWVTTAINGTTDEKPDFVTSAKMGESDLTFFAVFANVEGNFTEITDNLDNTLIGQTTYGDWSGKTAESSAVYAGNSTTGTNGATYIQIRSDNNNSGIVTTTSGGKIAKIAVTWNSTTADGRTLDIYGKNSAYAKATNLYDSNKQGTKLGSIVCGTSTELTIDGDYEFIGMRSASKAMYLDKIAITWKSGTSTISGYCTTVAEDTRKEAGISFAEAAVTKEIVEAYEGQALTNPNNLPVVWTSSNEKVATVDEQGKVTVLAVGETTITAKFTGNEEYKAATVSYTLKIQDSRVALELAFEEEAVSVNINEKVDAPELNGNAGNGAVTYESADETIATVDAATGEVTGVKAGKTTITATVAEVTGYMGGTATFDVNVIDPNAKGTENNPYTVAEAIAAIDANEGITGVYAKGIVSEIVTAYNSQFGNISYNISADGSTTGDQLQAYRGKSYEGANFTSADDIQVGDEVVIYGDLKKYNDIYEFGQNNQLVSLQRIEKADPELAFNPTTINVNLGATEYTVPTLTNPNNLTVTYSSDNEDVAVVDKNTGNLLLETSKEGTATITATFAGNDEFKAGSAEYTITVIDPNKTEEVFTLGVALGLANGDVFESQTLTNGTVVAFKATGSNVSKFYTSNNTTRVYKGNIIAIASSTKGIKSITFDLAQGNVTVANSDYESENLTWTVENGKAANTVMFNVGETTHINSITVVYTDIEPITANVSDAKYATFASANTVDFSKTGITAYATKYNSKANSVRLTEIEDGIVPANTAVVLYAEEAVNATIPFAVPTNVVTSDLKVSDGTIAGTENIFALANNATYGVGFYNVAATVTIPAGKAYLEIPAGEAREFIGFENEATGIVAVGRESLRQQGAYTLSGQRIAAPAKGLYIVNGKKMVIK